MESALGWLAERASTTLLPMRVQFSTISLPRAALLMRFISLDSKWLDSMTGASTIAVASLNLDEFVVHVGFFSLTIVFRGLRLDLKPR